MTIVSFVSGLFSSTTTKLALVGVVIAFAAGGYLGWHERGLREPAALTAQQRVDTAACNSAQAITKGKNDALQTAYTRIAHDAAKYKRLHPDRCYHITGAGELPADRGKHADMHGISASWLRDYAALCETYRSELIVCTGH